MKFLEKDLENILHREFATNGGYDLTENRGLYLDDNIIKVLRQRKIGEYGVADMITAHKSYEYGVPSLVLTVIELKKDRLNIFCLEQLMRYMRGVDRYLKVRGIKRYKVKGLLIGSGVVGGDWVFMENFMDDVTIQSYQYNVDGIRFNLEHGFRKGKEGFNV